MEAQELIDKYNNARMEWIMSSISSDENYEKACQRLENVVEEIRLWREAKQLQSFTL